MWTDGVDPRAADLLRAGLIAHATGDEDAWDYVLRALVLDSAVEHADPTYMPGIAALVTEREGRGVEISTYLATLRRQHAEPVPDISLAMADGSQFALREKRGKTLFVNFFSPNCSSCQFEIPATRSVFEAHSSKLGYREHDSYYELLIRD